MDVQERLYAIREVSEMTGVKPVTLRAWQRRYHLIQPARTEKGHRLYSDTDIQAIQQIQHWLAKGVSIGKVAEFMRSPQEVVTDEQNPPILEECETLFSALGGFNRGKSEQIMMAVFRNYPLSVVEQRFIAPTQQMLNRLKGSMKSLQMGLFQSLMMTQLNWMLTVSNKASHRGKCLCVSLDMTGSIWAWIQALKWAEQGYYTVLLDGVDDPSGLLSYLPDGLYQRVDFFANRHLSNKQRQAIEEILQAPPYDLSFSGVLAHQYTQGSSQDQKTLY